MSLAAILLGIINIAIVIAILLLIGAVILWFMSWMGMAVPGPVQKGYIAVVTLIGLYMLVALLLGIPTLRIISHAEGWSPARIDWVSSGLWPGSCSRTEPVGIRQSLATAFAL